MDAALENKLERLLEKVQKPARYTGGEMNTQVLPFEEAEMTYAFCFPDTYEIAMSHLGMKILYGLVNEQPDQVCERFFMPWTDMKALMEALDRAVAAVPAVIRDGVDKAQNKYN